MGSGCGRSVCTSKTFPVYLSGRTVKPILRVLKISFLFIRNYKSDRFLPCEVVYFYKI